MFTGSELGKIPMPSLWMIAGGLIGTAFVGGLLVGLWVTPEKQSLSTLEDCDRIKSIATTAFNTISSAEVAKFRAEVFTLSLGICEAHYAMLSKSE